MQKIPMHIIVQHKLAIPEDLDAITSSTHAMMEDQSVMMALGLDLATRNSVAELQGQKELMIMLDDFFIN